MAELRRLLIANRGEIAVRIVRACREMGVAAIAAVAPGDESGLWVELADGSVEVDSYLDGPGIVRAAVAAGADAAHPGYGFLSEDPAFAELVIAAGLRWVGPPLEAMRRLGDKVAARALAAAAGVPVVPGSEVVADDDALLAAAKDLGMPLLVKAAAGGGGRGMRSVDDLADLEGALAAAREEAAAGFGDGRVFLERRLDGVRHVEVQVLRDDHGHAVHLGERDCSLQRRHQKLVEESPSPAVTPELRTALGTAAIEIAERADYLGAGTAEFLVGADGRSWWFLEMNARLQVEHPVTEAVTGIDLVQAQLEIAAGSALGFAQDDVKARGHAIEARVYAEDPANGFLPTGGRVALLEFPRWPGVRIDTALRQGDEVGLGYDPLLAKVIAHAGDRKGALRKLRAALSEVRIVGVATNLGFLLDVLDRPEVVDGTAGTDWVERSWTPHVPTLPDGAHAERSGSDPWIAFGPAVADGSAPDVAVAGGHAQYRGWSYRLGDDDLVAEQLPPPGGALTAPMPATVLRVDARVGDEVEAGHVLALLEAMKTQVQVAAPTAGTIRAVHVHAGDVVARGESLIELEEA
jgi:acetyl-CoA/propionyl-CoA carboxylase biotin carboxyl carrier protein